MAIYLVRLSPVVNSYVAEFNPNSIQLYDAVDVTLQSHLLDFNSLYLESVGFTKCENWGAQYWDSYVIRTDFTGYNPIYEIVIGRLRQKLRSESIDKIID